MKENYFYYDFNNTSLETCSSKEVFFCERWILGKSLRKSWLRWRSTMKQTPSKSSLTTTQEKTLLSFQLKVYLSLRFIRNLKIERKFVFFGHFILWPYFLSYRVISSNEYAFFLPQFGKCVTLWIQLRKWSCSWLHLRHLWRDLTCLHPCYTLTK